MWQSIFAIGIIVVIVIMAFLFVPYAKEDNFAPQQVMSNSESYKPVAVSATTSPASSSQVLFPVPQGFRGPTSPPRINGPSGPPPSY